MRLLRNSGRSARAGLLTHSTAPCILATTKRHVRTGRYSFDFLISICANSQPSPYSNVGRKNFDTDWQLAQTLYCQGFPITDIANRSNATPSAIRTRVYRYGWADLRVTKAEQEKTDLETLSIRTRWRLAKEIDQQITQLLLSPCLVRELPGRDGRAATVSTIAGCAEKVFGWKENQAVTVALISPQPANRNWRRIKGATSECIDVAPEPKV